MDTVNVNLAIAIVFVILIFSLCLYAQWEDLEASKQSVTLWKGYYSQVVRKKDALETDNATLKRELLETKKQLAAVEEDLEEVMTTRDVLKNDLRNTLERALLLLNDKQPIFINYRPDMEELAADTVKEVPVEELDV
jgi:septal ring factor EnvC (AmiA/AmiB activator)